jgi:heme/copper-type cytochrome/quinol oxidase subunit 2
MSLKVKESLALLVASGLIYAWFAHRMLDGWRVADQSADDVMWVLIAAVVVTGIVYGIVSAVLAGFNRDKIAEDERDAAIDNKAARNELFVLNALINIFIFQILAQTAYDQSINLHVAYDHLPTLTFILFTALWIGEWVRLGSILWYSRS